MLQYRQDTQYEGVYKYVAPEGYHWDSLGTNYGKVVWGGKDLMNPYMLVKDKDYENNTD